MTEQQIQQQTIQAHQQRQQAIADELRRLIEESKEIAAQLQQLQADRMNTRRRPEETVQS